MLSFSEQKRLFHLIKEIGSEAEKIKKRDFDVVYKDDQSPLSQADTFVNNELIKFIKSTNFPNVISEENKQTDYSIRKNWEFFWLVDPIDGTKEFIKKNNDYTINIALCKKDTPIFSVVYAPARGELFHAEKGKGAFLNGAVISDIKSNQDQYIIVASKSHLNKDTEDYISKIKREKKVNLIQFGSSLKICKVAEGVADIYPRFGPTMEWDICAAHLILMEAGGKCTNLNKEDIKYNKINLLNEYFIATRKGIDL